MSSGPGGERGHLDASGPREVVYCHQCENEWFNDEHGLVCPRCDGEITEIVIPGESDPRPPPNVAESPNLRDLRDHNPWGAGDSDPEEADIEEHITHGPGGSVLFSRTVRSSTRGTFGTARDRPARRDRDPFREDPENVMRDFQEMVNGLMGPTLRSGQVGRSGPDTLFTQGPFGLRMSGNGPQPNVGGTRFTFTTTGGRPRNAQGGQPGDPNDIATLLGNILAGPPGGGHGEEEGGRGIPGGMPAGLAALFGGLFNPINARSGDAVYTQEALDQIISTLMEQHPTSNAPGPAPPDAIAALPKKKLDYELLGPEGKGECSVCMDDVKIGDEVVMLPCHHWFHETCAGAWLGEHNTCPICRKGLDSPGGSTNTPSSSAAEARRSAAPSPPSRNEYRPRRLSTSRPFMSMGRSDMTSPSQERNEARLNAIRNVGSVPRASDQPSPDRQSSGFSFSGRYDSSRPTPPERQASGSNTEHTFQPSSGPGLGTRAGSSGMESSSSASEYGFSNGEARRSSRRSPEVRDRDRDREPRRASGSGSGNGGGAMGWLRDRWGSGHGRNE